MKGDVSSIAANNVVTRSRRDLEAGALSIAVRVDDDEICVIQLFGEADRASAELLEATLARAEHDRPIVVDLSGLDSIDSSAVTVLVRAVARARANYHHIWFLRGAASVETTIGIAGAADQLPFLD